MPTLYTLCRGGAAQNSMFQKSVTRKLYLYQLYCLLMRMGVFNVSYAHYSFSTTYVTRKFNVPKVCHKNIIPIPAILPNYGDGGI